ncbi:MAG: hypothetical protein EPN25_11815 [Nitrospirae bacterium]|nr:MAG: hypothetical protein EPN25_11815 [Nitrospirota bacterium]
MTPEQKIDKALTDTAILSPLIAASLLNAVYSYLAWKKPMDYDEKTYQDALQTVTKDWNSLTQQILATVSRAVPKQAG